MGKLRWREWSERWNTLWYIGLRFKKRWCWLVGHKSKCSYGLPGTECWCDRCLMDDPGDDEGVLPQRLTRLYVRTVERDWRWFNKLDDWLLNDAPTGRWRWLWKRLPSWWEY